MARPHIKLDENEIERLAAEGYTNEWVARKLGVSVDTITRNYADAIKKGRENEKVSFLKRCRDQAFSDEKNNLGWGVLYSKLRGWLIEKQEQTMKAEISNKPVDEEKLKELREAIACLET